MVLDPREELCAAALHVYQRRLTDTAGGNLSVRVAGRLLGTPRYAGSQHWWKLTPDMIVETDLAGVWLAGGEVSREWQAHVAVYRHFPEVTAVVHAHPENVMIFAHMGRPIPPASEQASRWGTIGVCRSERAHSAGVAEAIVEAFEPQRTSAGGVMATLIPDHGILVAGPNLHLCIEALDGIDQSARTIVARAILANASPGG